MPTDAFAIVQLATDLHRLVEQRRGFGEAAVEDRDPAEVGECPRQAHPMAQLAFDAQVFFEQGARGLVLAFVEGQSAQAAQRERHTQVDPGLPEEVARILERRAR